MSGSAGAGDPEPIDEPSWWGATLGVLLITPIIAPLIFIITLPALLYKAWVITILWQWFVIPVFNLPPLPFGYAGGLLLIFYCLTASGDPPKRKYSKEEIVLVFIGPIMGPTASLAAGWIVKAILCP